MSVSHSAHESVCSFWWWWRSGFLRTSTERNVFPVWFFDLDLVQQVWAELSWCCEPNMSSLMSAAAVRTLVEPEERRLILLSAEFVLPVSSSVWTNTEWAFIHSDFEHNFIFRDILCVLDSESRLVSFSPLKSSILSEAEVMIKVFASSLRGANVKHTAQ